MSEVWCVHRRSIYIEVLSVLLKYLKRSLSKHATEYLVDVTSISCEDLELFGLREILKLGKLLDETIEQLPSLLNELVILVAHEFLLGNCGNIHAWPPRCQCFSKSIKLRVPARFFKRTILIYTWHCIFNVAAHLYLIEDSKLSNLRIVFSSEYVLGAWVIF